MPDPFRKLTPGDSIPREAVVWNAMLGAGQDWLSGKFSRTANDLTTGRSSALVRVRNDSGADADRNTVLGLDGPVFTPTDNVDVFLREVTFKGVTPAASHRGRFCVLLEPIGADRVGRAWVAGVCQVRLDVVDVEHKRADVIVGDGSKLRSADGGAAYILWKEDDDSSYYYAYGTGDQWAIVLLGQEPVEIVYGKTGGGGIPARSGTTLGSATVTVYSKSGATIANTGTTATCYNVGDAAGANKYIGMWPRGDGTFDLIVESCS